MVALTPPPPPLSIFYLNDLTMLDISKQMNMKSSILKKQYI